jgi:hypothetical protein
LPGKRSRSTAAAGYDNRPAILADNKCAAAAAARPAAVSARAANRDLQNLARVQRESAADLCAAAAAESAAILAAPTLRAIRDNLIRTVRRRRKRRERASVLNGKSLLLRIRRCGC